MLARPKSETVEVLDSQPKSLLRFLTCGSVDDGKSTLIGRLLYECGAVFDDQLIALEQDSKRFGTDGDNFDFALLVDGLSAEREQGITIDVAYRYFSTPRRAFIVADTPGHEQYTRNMATGASTADLAILLVDARRGLLVQTRRHAFIASLLRVPHVILAVNKMDLVDFDETVFRQIEQDFRAIAKDLGFGSITAIPLNARGGDNVVQRSSATPWYKGKVLLSELETIDAGRGARQSDEFSFPVQWVNRPDAFFRGFSGTLASGTIAVGDKVAVLASGQVSEVGRIVTADGDLEMATAGQAVTLVLADEIDASRGDVLASPGGGHVQVAKRVKVHLFWTGQLPGRELENYIVQLASDQAQVRIQDIHHGLDMETFARVPIEQINMNAVALVSLTLHKPLAVADYQRNGVFGSLILIDRSSNETVAIGLIDQSADIQTALVHGRDGADKLTHRWAGVQRWLDRKIGVRRSQQRLAFFKRASWRMVSAMLVALLAGSVTGSAWFAIVAGIGDLAARPFVRRLHGRLWSRFGDKGNAYRDGDGI